MRYWIKVLPFLWCLPCAVQAGEWRYVNLVQSEQAVDDKAVEQSMSTSSLSVTPTMSAAVVNAPVNNMTMQKVRQHYGQPNLEMAPVGEPPITRWHYSDYTVYFEIDRVIISVITMPR